MDRAFVVVTAGSPSRPAGHGRVAVPRRSRIDVAQPFHGRLWADRLKATPPIEPGTPVLQRRGPPALSGRLSEELPCPSSVPVVPPSVTCPEDCPPSFF